MSRLLVVDDGEDLLLVVRSTLESAGHQVVATTDPEIALEWVSTGHFDAIVLDIMMPKLSGLQVLKVIRSRPRTREVPVLLLSALGEPLDQASVLKVGADDYLVKPFDPGELVARIAELVSHSSSPANREGAVCGSNPRV